MVNEKSRLDHSEMVLKPLENLINLGLDPLESVQSIAYALSLPISFSPEIFTEIAAALPLVCVCFFCNFFFCSGFILRRFC